VPDYVGSKLLDGATHGNPQINLGKPEFLPCFLMSHFSISRANR
jgi:hypothetical protein